MTHLSSMVFHADQVRELDRIAIEDRGIAGYELMCRAGQAALDRLKIRWPSAKSLGVICGSGNNAGDGYVIARLAEAAGMRVSVIALVDPAKLGGDAATAFADYRATGPEPAIGFDGLPAADIYVDAILGTGLDRPLDGIFLDAVRALNSSGAPVLAIDIPTGLHPDTGWPHGNSNNGDAVRADATISFIGRKSGCFLGAGPAHTGQLFHDDLAVPADISDGMSPVMLCIGDELSVSVLPRRKKTAHKGDHGHVLIIGGNRGMPGAVCMSGEAALRTGAGLVTLATHPDHAQTCTVDRPELMSLPVDSGDDLDSMLDRATVIAIGPGLGTDAWARELLEHALCAGKSMVIDADALNLVSEMAMTPKRDDWVATPHPGEAARLMGTDTNVIQQDRLGTAVALQRLLGGVVVLKGAASLVAGEQKTPRVCIYGNPGMASAGFGDVLTGVCAGVIAQTCQQGIDLFDAACCAVDAHARAADLAAGSWERGLIASDVFPYLRSCVNPIQ